MSGRSASGFGHPGFSSAGGFQGDIDPSDLFNMFFGGGGGGMGGNGFGGANGESGCFLQIFGPHSFQCSHLEAQEDSKLVMVAHHNGDAPLKRPTKALLP